MFGVRTRNSGTPLLAVIVDSQQKTSSATIYTPAPSPRTFALLFTSGDNVIHAIVVKLYINNAGEGGFHVSGQSFIHFQDPLPLHLFLQTGDIHKLTDWSSNTAVEILSLKSLVGVTIRRLAGEASPQPAGLAACVVAPALARVWQGMQVAVVPKFEQTIFAQEV